MTFIIKSFSILRMNTFKFLFSILLIASLFSCSQLRPTQAEISIQTDKVAKVALKDPQTEQIEEIGMTPLKMSMKDLVEKNKGSEWMMLIISAPGYAVEHLLIPSYASTKINLDLKLKPIEWWNDPSKLVSSQVINTTGKMIQKIYSHIRQSQLDEALGLTEKLIAEYPHASFFLDLKGSIQVLQGKKAEAISSYERSLQISSDNPETMSILSDLKKEGVR
jgi:tetratricopeptide (TPR) repeat protein